MKSPKHIHVIYTTDRLTNFLTHYAMTQVLQTSTIYCHNFLHTPADAIGRKTKRQQNVRKNSQQSHVK